MNYVSDFSHFIATQLNPEQQRAVTHTDGVLLVCAGAGSGKTRVITARIAHLILNQKVPASSIIALTFTNKAAREMKERVASFLPEGTALPFVGTFHSYCLNILKQNNDIIRVPNFSIMDDDDQEKLVKTIIMRHGLQKRVTTKNVRGLISRLKNECVTGSLNLNLVPDLISRTILHAYEHEKTLAKCLDFDDLMLDVLTLFKKKAVFKNNHVARVKHILVDEYQDTNLIQHALLQEMTTLDKKFAVDSLCVVGDEDQAIYSWRGATVTNILNFARDFPQTVRITIDQNYRSVQPILETANHIIRNNNQRHEKKLWSQRPGSDRIRIITCATGVQEGDIVAQFSKQRQAQEALGETAILYRSHYQSRVLEEALIRHSVPYKIIGGIQFYERLEIKDLLAYLKLIANPYDRISFLRVINTPSRGFGDKFQELFLQAWEANPDSSFVTIATQMIANSELPPSRIEALQRFIALFASSSRISNAYTTLNEIIKNTEYTSYLKTSFAEDEATAKCENVKELLQAIVALESRGITTVQEFLEEVTLLQAQSLESDDSGGVIKLMTLHAAKGLEFDCVVLTGLEEGIIPSNHSLYDAEAVEEERRLLYVGITRARERLLITHAHSRTIFGTTTDQRSSRFMKEFPAQHIVKEDLSRMPSYQIIHYFQQWLNGSSATKSASIQPVFEEPFKEIRPANLWYKDQKVQHKLFGAGVIESVEERESATYLTVRFGIQRKRLDSRFVHKV